ncbi:MAG: 30S ribosomal protein S8 [Deltaproteobacteria bacterium]|nr:30S ribosomal protein S8 [Deltaproteobacteria bacterium]
MGMTDPVADMLTRIRNAGLAKHKKVDMPFSKQKAAIAAVLRDLGYVKNFKTVADEGFETLRVYLKYDEENAPVIHEIERVSRPGRRVYVGCDEIPKVKNGLGCAILSTSKGVLSDEGAHRAEVGGELICKVW